MVTEGREGGCEGEKVFYEECWLCGGGGGG